MEQLTYDDDEPQNPYTQGWRAGEDNHISTTNPYPRGSTDWARWDTGYSDAITYKQRMKGYLYV